jgi:hypothetical protein
MSRVHNPRVIEEVRDRIGRLEGSAAKKAIVLPFGGREMDEQALVQEQSGARRGRSGESCSGRARRHLMGRRRTGLQLAPGEEHALRRLGRARRNTAHSAYPARRRLRSLRHRSVPWAGSSGSIFRRSPRRANSV